MKTLLIGAGSIGGVIAVLTKQAGYDVSIMCHSESTKNAIINDGFKLTGARGNYKQDFVAYSSYDELGEQKFDFVIIATKYSAMAEAANAVLPYLKDDSLVIGMQNGLCTNELAQIVGRNRAVGVMLGFGATRISANEVNMTSKGEMYIGTLDGQKSGNMLFLAQMLSSVLPTKISADITREQYSKLIINSCINACAAITGKTLGVIIDDKRARNLFLAIAREGTAVAKAMNLSVPKYGLLLDYRAIDIADNKVYNSMMKYVIWIVSKAYGNVKPSTLQSLERGEKTEIDIFNGYFATKGVELGIETPVNTKLVSMIHEIERGEREITPDNLDEFNF